MTDQAGVDAIFAALDGSVAGLDALLAHVRACIGEQTCPVCLGPVLIREVALWPEDKGMECVPCGRVFPGWAPDGTSAETSQETRENVSSFWRLTWTEIREGL